MKNDSPLKFPPRRNLRGKENKEGLKGKKKVGKETVSKHGGQENMEPRKNHDRAFNTRTQLLSYPQIVHVVLRKSSLALRAVEAVVLVQINGHAFDDEFEVEIGL